MLDLPADMEYNMDHGYKHIFCGAICHMVPPLLSWRKENGSLASEACMNACATMREREKLKASTSRE